MPTQPSLTVIRAVRSTRFERAAAAASLAALFACGEPTPSAEGGSTTGEVDAGTAETTTGTSTGAPTTGDGTTGEPPDLTQCDVWAQDCPDGQKCMAYAKDGDQTWNAAKCVPVVADPRQSGESCQAIDGGFTGLDNCDAGLMCLVSDYTTLSGKCVEQCTGSPDAPECPDGKLCSISTDDVNGVLARCLQPCDPLSQDCAAEEICIYNFADYGETWVCDTKVPGDGGLYASCLYSNACEKGLMCLGSISSTDCDQGILACCLPLCDLTAPENCPDDLMCLAWYVPGMEVPGYENVGYCSLPL